MQKIESAQCMCSAARDCVDPDCIFSSCIMYLKPRRKNFCYLSTRHRLYTRPNLCTRPLLNQILCNRCISVSLRPTECLEPTLCQRDREVTQSPSQWLPYSEPWVAKTWSRKLCHNCATFFNAPGKSRLNKLRKTNLKMMRPNTPP